MFVYIDMVIQENEWKHGYDKDYNWKKKKEMKQLVEGETCMGGG